MLSSVLTETATALAENGISFSYDGGRREIKVDGLSEAIRIRSDHDGLYIVGKNGSIELAVSEVVDYIYSVS